MEARTLVMGKGQLQEADALHSQSPSRQTSPAEDGRERGTRGRINRRWKALG